MVVDKFLGGFFNKLPNKLSTSYPQSDRNAYKMPKIGHFLFYLKSVESCCLVGDSGV